MSLRVVVAFVATFVLVVHSAAAAAAPGGRRWLRAEPTGKDAIETLEPGKLKVRDVVFRRGRATRGPPSTPPAARHVALTAGPLAPFAALHLPGL